MNPYDPDPLTVAFEDGYEAGRESRSGVVPLLLIVALASVAVVVLLVAR